MLVTVETNSDEEKTDRGVKLAKDGKVSAMSSDEL